MITVSALNDVRGVRHGFFTRQGGVSEGIYASLNCGLGSGDAPEKVRENRRRALQALEVRHGRLLTLRQIHSPRVLTVTEVWTDDEAPEADAMVTRQPGLVLGILTADCAPVVFADGKNRVIGAAHAGWKGAIGGVLDATLARMIELGAEPGRIVAAIGPCIAQRSYEVGAEFKEMFLADSPANQKFFSEGQRPGKFHFDLATYIGRRLGRLGLENVARMPCDTCREDSRFFSFRRATLRGEPAYGRLLSAIAMTVD